LLIEEVLRRKGERVEEKLTARKDQITEGGT